MNDASLLTLVLAVTSLDFLVHALLYFPLQDSCPRWLVIAGHLQDVGGIYVMVSPPPHDMIIPNIKLEHWHLKITRVRIQICAVTDKGG